MDLISKIDKDIKCSKTFDSNIENLSDFRVLSQLP